MILGGGGGVKVHKAWSYLFTCVHSNFSYFPKFITRDLNQVIYYPELRQATSNYIMVRKFSKDCLVDT
jgi:hypothetical protein